MSARDPRPLIVGASLVFGIFAAGVLSPGDNDAYSQELVLARSSGYAALIGLCCALCTTPATRLLQFLRLRAIDARAWRRAFGIASGSIALAHTALSIALVPDVGATLLSSPRLRFGLGALTALVFLLATSFPELVAQLRLQLWKELHRLAYVALAFALMHALLAPFASLRIVLSLAMLTLLIGALRLLPRRT
jgi:DMSO/TMAO reductase YedYZ heme-binding membrane subunit